MSVAVDNVSDIEEGKIQIGESEQMTLPEKKELNEFLDSIAPSELAESSAGFFSVGLDRISTGLLGASVTSLLWFSYSKTLTVTLESLVKRIKEELDRSGHCATDEMAWFWGLISVVSRNANLQFLYQVKYFQKLPRAKFNVFEYFLSILIRMNQLFH